MVQNIVAATSEFHRVNMPIEEKASRNKKNCVTLREAAFFLHIAMGINIVDGEEASSEK